MNVCKHLVIKEIWIKEYNINIIMEKKDPPMDKTKAKADLLLANKVYIECIEKNFLPRFFSDEKITIDEVCVDEYKKMRELDEIVYGKFEWPTTTKKPPK